jgi:arylsulfatase A-like enzyme
MASLFTSLYPINHGVIHGVFYKPTEAKHIISDKLITLAEILKAHGYTTFGVSSNLQLNKKRGFAKGFDYFKCQYKQSTAPFVNKTIYSWETEIKKSNKYFLWAHFMDPHGPYHARSPWNARYASKAPTGLDLSGKKIDTLREYIPTFKEDPQALSNLIALYDSEISFVDSYIGKLIQRFELDNNTLIIITADHGEEFLEHDQFTHGNNLFQETIRIPLIVKLPNSSQKRVVEKLVNLVDIMPTISELLNIIPPEQTLGKSFLEKKGSLFWIKKTFLTKDASEYNFSELDLNSTLKTIMTPEWKYIYNYKDKTEQLYNVKSDPLELHNLIDKKTKQASQLKEQLFQWVSNSKKYHSKGHSLKLSPEEKERLKALGYIE